MSLSIGSLFSGIGGLELGLERAGLGHVEWQCEVDPFCRAVLAKHWPNATRYADVREMGREHDEECDMGWDCTCGASLAAPPVDVVCGGFPCQDISSAGSRRGLDGERSSLWFEFLRIVRLVRPRIVIVENASALTLRGLGAVLGGLSESGYDAFWDCIPAAAVGAPFRRDRCFVVAAEEPWLEDLADPGCWGWREQWLAQSRGQQGEHGCESDGCASDGRVYGATGTGWWESEPGMARVAHGLSAGVDRHRVRLERRRLKAHGNAVVPQVAEAIGRAIVEVLP